MKSNKRAAVDNYITRSILFNILNPFPLQLNEKKVVYGIIHFIIRILRHTFCSKPFQISLSSLLSNPNP